MGDLAIRVTGLGKRYRLHHEARAGRYRTLREDIIQLPRRVWSKLLGAKDEEFWALKDVSFEVKPGEIVGVIGRNGAGKSTLLKILSRITPPTVGEVDLFGRVGSLLEVGTGFHPELTGRENIYLSGALLGMRRPEIRRRFDEIVAFAGVEKFLDTPCKHYSSGMYARLGFSVAAHLDTDILLVDEVLAVGDSDFRRRCSSKVAKIVQEDGRAVLIVSHEAALIRNLCNRTLLFKAGRVDFEGASDDALRLYYESFVTEGGTIIKEIHRVAPGFSIDDFRVGGSNASRYTLDADERWLEVEVSGRIEFAARVALEMRLCDSDGNVLAFCSPGHDAGVVQRFEPGPFSIGHKIELPRLLRGHYLLGFSLTDPNFSGWVEVPRAVQLEVEGSTTKIGILPAGRHCGWQLLNNEPLIK
jgi:ABC-type polysaccharide/polyol phosphate transport system ATPase subunit